MRVSVHSPHLTTPHSGGEACPVAPMIPILMASPGALFRLTMRVGDTLSSIDDPQTMRWSLDGFPR
jgi:hypothetical protein